MADARAELFRHKDPYDTAGTEEVFVAAMRENAAYQYANCAEYRAVLDASGFSPDMLRTPEDLALLPFLPTAFLKTHRMFSMPAYRRLVTATSSGTSGGGKSEVGLEFGALLAGAEMVRRVFAPRHILSPVPCHYVIFGYPPERGNGMAAAKTAFGYTFLAPAVSRTYALRRKNGNYEAGPERVIRAILRQENSPFPTRFIGFPAYAWYTFRRMEEKGLSVRLPRGSTVLLAGGWKQHYREAAGEEEMYALIGRVLGIPEDSVIECYGAAEHPILYCDCPFHHFHVPIYARVLIRDPGTFEPLPPGEGRMGLVNLLTPMIRATPVLSVLTDDLGILHGEGCPCGVNSPWLEIAGRAGMGEIRTCAAGAEEILGERRTLPGAGTETAR
jgi:hypothetical protein